MSPRLDVTLNVLDSMAPEIRAVMRRSGRECLHVVVTNPSFLPANIGKDLWRQNGLAGERTIYADESYVPSDAQPEGDAKLPVELIGDKARAIAFSSWKFGRSMSDLLKCHPHLLLPGDVLERGTYHGHNFVVAVYGVPYDAADQLAEDVHSKCLHAWCDAVIKAVHPVTKVKVA